MNNNMIDVASAISVILETTPLRSPVNIKIDNAIGNVLAQDIIATRHQPPFHRVAMDGIAINSSTRAENYPIENIQPAGSEQLTLTDSKNCIEVMTGATLPMGCDCVIPYENITINKVLNSASINLEDISTLKNVHQEASDYKQGDLLLKKGTFITAPVVATIASQGTSEISVYKKPSVAIISTGSELVDLDQKVLAHQIFMSNSYGIESELYKYGIENLERIHIVDDRQVTERLIQSALEDFDILVLTGGVSKGKFDFIPDSLANLGVKKHFHKIKQKPGKPMWYGTAQKKQVFALPGNPVSCLICLRRYVIPSINKSIQYPESDFIGELQKNVQFKKNFSLFKPVTASHNKEGRLLLSPVDSNGSGDFFSLSHSDGFIELPADREEFLKGEHFSYFPWQI